MKTITSFSNPIVKEVIKLRERRERSRSGYTVIDGIREVRAALDAGVDLKDIFVCPSLYQGQAQGDVDEILQKLVLRNNKIEVFEVTKEIFAKISFGDRAEGLLAVGKPQLKTLRELQLKKDPIIMLIESVEKPGNVGAILRTCDATGIDTLIVCDPATDIYNPNVIRASLGTVFNVSIVTMTAQEARQFLSDSNIKIVAATPSGQKNYTAVDFCRGVAIAIGSEKDGLSPFWLDAADEKVSIPMKGQADSLNTSVAAALMAYEVLRQRESR